MSVCVGKIGIAAACSMLSSGFALARSEQTQALPKLDLTTLQTPEPSTEQSP